VYSFWEGAEEMFPESKAISVVTLNTWKGDGAYLDRIKLIQEQAADLEADIMLLQEAFKAESCGYDTAKYLAEKLGMAFAAQPARMKVRRVDDIEVMTTSGLAVLTHGKIISNEALLLDSDPNDGDRISQFVEIKLQNSQILVVNTHLTHLENRDHLRIKQLNQTLNWISDNKKYDLIIFGGDLNCVPDSQPVSWLLNTHLIETQEACHHLGRRFSTIDDGSDQKQVDYIFRLGNSRFRLEAVRRVFDLQCPTKNIYPSDHFGVWTRFSD